MILNMSALKNPGVSAEPTGLPTEVIVQMLLDGNSASEIGCTIGPESDTAQYKLCICGSGDKVLFEQPMVYKSGILSSSTSQCYLILEQDLTLYPSQVC